jgi:hypothetical protein
MLALSINQPWAWAIINAGKDIENRYWKTSVRGRILIHASRAVIPLWFKAVQEISKMSIPENVDYGGIVGSVIIINCVKNHHSKWAAKGQYNFILSKPIPLPFFSCRGKPGFFEVPGYRVPEMIEG